MEKIDVNFLTSDIEIKDQKRPIIILALPKHDDDFTCTPFLLAQEFAKENLVWYISHPYTWIDFFKRIGKKKAWKRLKATFQVQPVLECNKVLNINILYLPITLPINSFPPGKLYNFLSSFNHGLVSKTINKVIRKDKINNYIFINSHDFYFGRIHRMLPSTFQYIYQCIDPIIKSYSARHGSYLEKVAASEADMVISTSPFLQRKMESNNQKSYCVPNAANYALSHKATLTTTAVYPEIQIIEGKKIGYIGNIERRIHYVWLVEIFSRHPEWQLIMVGPKDESFIPGEFMNLPNLHLLPPVPHEQLPNVLKGFDVAIIPFKKDNVSAQIYPLKLFEYMGSGKPVVTTDFNEEIMEPYKQWIYVGTSVEELERAIEVALTENDPRFSEERIKIASENDWSSRGKQFLSLVNSDVHAQ